MLPPKYRTATPLKTQLFEGILYGHNIGELQDKLAVKVDLGENSEKRTTRVIPSFRKYSGIDEAIGTGLFYNTPGASRQLISTLEMVDHPTIEKYMGDDKITPDNFDADRLVKEKILLEIKILDLGCGIPVYANCVHALGADVYTADYSDVHSFVDDAMKDKHIIVDFNDPSAIELILHGTGGNFDLVTRSHALITPLDDRKLETPSEERMDEISLALLKIGGIAYADGTMKLST